jgi:hypothetical protein
MESFASESIHPSAPHDLPSFITAPGDTDVLMVVVGIMLIGAVLAVGNFYLHLHTMPERMAHKSQKLQFEIVAVLGLLALFTHNQLFARSEARRHCSKKRRTGHQSLNVGSMHPPQTQGKVQSAVRLALSGMYLLQASARTGLIDCQMTSKVPEEFILPIMTGLDR